MNQEEQLQLIEDVCLSVFCNLRACRTGKLDEDNALKLMKQELQKLEYLESEPPKPPSMEAYLLTAPNCGPKAYLCKNMDDGWVVEVDGYKVTGTYSQPKIALDEYVSQSESDDFIDDFVVGVEDGTCEFGHSNYAIYVEKCFNSYVFGKAL